VGRRRAAAPHAAHRAGQIKSRRAAGEKEGGSHAAFLLFSGVDDMARGAKKMSCFDPKNIIPVNRFSMYLTDAECFLP
jgi:hypothetical protein